jgi:quercetin dioxygenase-like cupin family protein
MGVIHKCIGDWNAQPEWSGSRQRSYDSEETRGVTETWLIGKAEGAKNFALRYYEVEPYGFSQEESHEHDHGIIILHGEGEVQLKDKTVAVEAGDVIYILPNERHQLRNRGEEPLGFFCIIPAVRSKGDKSVWAEEGYTDLTTVD